MRLPSAIAFLTLLTLVFAADAAPTPSPRQVDIPLGNGTLHAQLYKPEGDGPFPVVIALHGCGGVGRHSEPGQERYRDLARQLIEDGNSGLLPGRYRSRGRGPPNRCNGKQSRQLRPRALGAGII